MLIDTPGKIIGYAGVEFAVFTFNDIDAPRHKRANADEIYTSFGFGHRRPNHGLLACGFDAILRFSVKARASIQQTLQKEFRGILIRAE